MPPVASSWLLPGGELDISHGVLVGVLNVTPDSFSDGGLFHEAPAALDHALAMQRAGAALIDVGGESTRPGAEPVPVEVEADRAIPVVRALAELGVRVSIDTFKPEVAELAVASGACVVNDVTGFEDERMIELVCRTEVGVVVMHGRGQALDTLPPDADAVAEVESYLCTRAQTLVDAGVDPHRIALDPGLGFGKRHAQSVALLANVERLVRHGFPLMIGASRKGFLRGLSGAETWEARDSVTATISALTYLRGARLFRVHDVAKSRAALIMVAAIVASQRWDEWQQDSSPAGSRG